MIIPVHLGERSYKITVSDSFKMLPGHLKSLGLTNAGWIISHRRLLKQHGKELRNSLKRAGWRLKIVEVPETESSKSIAMANRIITEISRGSKMQVPVLIAFGGGVVGDLAGFVAAVFRRGIPYIQVPTTLLAQVDSSIGGKVGVDLPHAKNLVDAFYQPRAVWDNISVLETLPMRQRRSGVAEVIKCGVISDLALFRFLEKNMGSCLSFRTKDVRVMVESAARVKVRMISQDEKETKDLRVRLNFGHTLGHALEAATGFNRFSHGEAISVGMCAAAELGVAVGCCRLKDSVRIRGLIDCAGLPTHVRGVSRWAVLKALSYDKKFIHGRPRWVLPKGIGQVIVTEDVPKAIVSRVIERYIV